MTSIYNSKPIDEISKRIKKSYRRMEIYPIALKSNIAFKQVEVSQYLEKLIDYYPNFRTILILRKPEGVISSILKKQWFSHNQLYKNSGKWFFRKGKKWNMPDWLNSNEGKIFLKLKESERAALYYINEYKNFKNILKKKNFSPIVLDYDIFTSDPNKIFNKITTKLDLKFGDLTNKILKKVNENKKTKKIKGLSFQSELFTKATQLYYDCSNKILK